MKRTLLGGRPKGDSKDELDPGSYLLSFVFPGPIYTVYQDIVSARFLEGRKGGREEVREKYKVFFVNIEYNPITYPYTLPCSHTY